MRITGMTGYFSLMDLASWRPSISGILMSASITLKLVFVDKIVRACLAELAAIGDIFHDFICAERILSRVELSSTIRICLPSSPLILAFCTWLRVDFRLGTTWMRKL